MTSGPSTGASRRPMFPLGSVVFPYTAVPLRVFEPRYQNLLDRVLDDDRRFGMVLIERGFEVGGGDQRFSAGTLVRIVDVAGLAEGHRAIVVAGIERIRVTEWLPDDPHPWATVEPWPDDEEPVGGDDVQAALAALERVLALASELGADVGGIEPEVADDPVAASYQVAALAPVTALDAQRLLEAAGPATRLRQAVEALEDRAEYLRLELGGQG